MNSITPSAKAWLTASCCLVSGVLFCFLAFSGLTFFENQYIEAILLFFSGLIGAISGLSAAGYALNNSKLNAKKEIQLITVVILAALTFGLLSAALVLPNKAAPIGIWCLAFIAIGSFVGFLFAIPRVLQDGTDKLKATTANSSTARGGYRLVVNTNLEQVSDWLTKIIIGLGLVNLNTIPTHLRNLGQQFQSWLGGTDPIGPLLGEATVIYFSITGFFGGYLITRLYLSEILNAVESGFGNDVLPSDTQAILAQGIDVTRPEPTIAPKSLVAAAKIANSLIDSLTTLTDKNLWAKAQMILGNYKMAIPVFREMITSDPNDLINHLELSEALTLNKDFVGAYGEIKNCLAMVNTQTDRALFRRVYRTATYLALFQNPPDLDQAILLAQSYLKSTSNYQSASIQINLACAYGQKYAQLAKINVDDPQLLPIENSAYDALSSALAIEPGRASIIKTLLGLNGPVDRSLDDLLPFGIKARFQQLVGINPTNQ